MPQENQIEPLLEAILENQDSNAKSQEQLLENILELTSNQNPESLLEVTLEQSEKNAKDIIQAIKEIPEIKFPEQKDFPEIKFPDEIKVSNQINLKTLEDKISAVEQAILGRKDKEVDLKPVVTLLRQIRDKEESSAEISIPDLSGKIDELIDVIKAGQIIEVNETTNEANYTEKFDALIKEVKKMGKVGFTGAGFDTVYITGQDGVRRNPATSEKQDTGNTLLTDFLFNYKLSDIDDSTTTYLGYLKKDGAWYIQKITSAGAVTYAAGASGYNWSNRASETYNIFSTTF